ncbi:MAG: hypothetical protein ACPG5P_07890, partial [Saprospiraceae bacterium]
EDPRPMPNAMAVMILGVLSILMVLLTCCLSIIGNIPGAIMAGVGYYLSMEGKQMVDANPSGQYIDHQNWNVGRILCMVGFGLNVLMVILYIIFVIIYGVALTSNSFNNF